MRPTLAAYITPDNSVRVVTKGHTSQHLSSTQAADFYKSEGHKPPRVLFVEGFNGVGKDHAIRTLCEKLAARGIPTAVLDPRFHLPKVIASQRFFTFKHFDEGILTQILCGHLAFLEKIAGVLDTVSKDTVLITNRSFLTAVHYNFFAVRENKAEDGMDLIDRRQLRKDAIDTYASAHSRLLSKASTALLNLVHFHDQPVREDSEESVLLDDMVTLFKEKITKRDGKQNFDDSYVKYLIAGFRDTHPYSEHLGIQRVHMHSGQVAQALELLYGFKHIDSRLSV
jgi:hypothetical protein